MISTRPERRLFFYATALFLLCFLLPFIDFFANFYKARYRQEKRMTGCLAVQDYDRTAGKTPRFLNRRRGLFLASEEPLT